MDAMRWLETNRILPKRSAETKTPIEDFASIDLEDGPDPDSGGETINFAEALLLLVVAANSRHGFVQTRRRRDNAGRARLLYALESTGCLVPVRDKAATLCATDYIIDAYRITSRGKRLATSLSPREFLTPARPADQSLPG
jgi:hypothetical protein